MGITKNEIFSPLQNNLAGLAKVLGHPARIAILEYLMTAKDCIGNDLVEEIGLAQPTISQHLKELKTAGLIKGTIEGNSVCYCINAAVWAEAKELLSAFMKKDVAQLLKCC